MAPNMVATAPEPSKWKPRAAAPPSTAAASSICAMISSTRNHGQKEPTPLLRRLPTKSTIMATPWADRFLFPTITIQTKRRPSSSSPRNGGRRAIPLRRRRRTCLPRQTFLPMPSEPGTSVISVRRSLLGKRPPLSNPQHFRIALRRTREQPLLTLFPTTALRQRQSEPPSWP